MMAPRELSKWIGTLKTALLLLLVAISGVLSYQLWIGFWEPKAGQVGTEVLPTPAASTPSESELLRPTRLIVEDKDASQTVVVMPGHRTFGDWMAVLSKLSLNGLRQENIDTTQFHQTVKFQFDYALNNSQLTQLIPSLSHYSVNLSANQVLLNEDPWTDTVSLVLLSSYGNDSFSTQLSSSQFTQLFSESTKQPSWTLAPSSNDAYVPTNGLTMQATVWSTKPPAQMTLVRSFFVNPLALTSLSGNSNSDIWTDGSRIVWWNQPTGTLTFQDPNASSATTSTLPGVEVAADFIRAHGGCPKSGVTMATNSLPNAEWMDSFSVRPIVNGYPIVDGSADYQVQFEVGQIMQYTRPIWTFANQLSSKPVHILGYKQLTSVLTQLSPGFTWSKMSVDLGYATQIKKNNEITCEPVYVISSNGYTFWTLSAVTGQPVKGGALA